MNDQGQLCTRSTEDYAPVVRRPWRAIAVPSTPDASEHAHTALGVCYMRRQ